MKKVFLLIILNLLSLTPHNSTIAPADSAIIVICNRASTENINQIVELSKMYQPRDSIMRKFIDFISSHEGRTKKPYPDANGKLIVGAGHILTKNDHALKFPLTDFQIDSLIVSDIERAESYYLVDTEISSQYINFNLRWVIIHLIYAKGIGRFQKNSALRDIILYRQHDTLALKKELLDWSYINGSTRSKWSTKIRLKEYNFILMGSF